MKISMLLILVACAGAAASFEPIAVDGGLIAGTPSPQWTYCQGRNLAGAVDLLKNVCGGIPHQVR